MLITMEPKFDQLATEKTRITSISNARTQTETRKSAASRVSESFIRRSIMLVVSALESLWTPPCSR